MAYKAIKTPNNELGALEVAKPRAYLKYTADKVKWVLGSAHLCLFQGTTRDVMDERGQILYALSESPNIS